MTIDRAATPFVLLAAVPAVVAFWAGPLVLAGALGALPVLVALFFRDPDRKAPSDPASILAPADGKVMHAGPAKSEEAPPGRWLQVTVFLSPLDVHINRTPVSGRVTKVEYVPGTFAPAFRHDSHRNEHSEIWINHDGVEIVVRQVVGTLARRVVCRVRPGDVLGPGDRIGLMKFGSRMDVFMPDTAEVLVRRGDQLRGGETVIARLPLALGQTGERA
jgi:phosphatidylserine decarboxylase